MQAQANQREQLDDVIVGRWLAWIGGVATLTGLVLLLALAIAHGWIGPAARAGLAAVGASGLVAAGAWLKERLGRIEAPLAMVFAGIAGLDATLVAADRVSGLIGSIPALIGVAVVATTATALAVRWRSRTIGVLGLIAPLVTGLALAPGDGVPVFALLAVAAAVAAGIAAAQLWGWIACGVVLFAEIDIAAWMLSRPPSSVGALAIVPFALLAIATAAALQDRRPHGDRSRAANTLLVFSALVSVVAAGVSQAPDAVASVDALSASIALVAFALVHVALAIVGIHRRPTLEPLAAAALTVATVLFDLALAINLHGIALTAGFGASTLVLTFVRRRPAERLSDRALVDIGLTAHAGLVLLKALIAAPPSVLASGGVTGSGVAALAILAVICIAAARTAPFGTEFAPTVLGAVGLATTAYLTAVTLSGPALVSAWCAEAVALAALARRERDGVAAYAALGFLLAGWIHTLAIEAPPWALITGASSLPAALLALGSAAVATEVVRRAVGRGDALLWLAAVTPLYLASVAIITVFQPAMSAGLAVLDLTVRQQGQVLISALWTVSGLGCLIVGLRREQTGLRHGGLILLLISAAKVFLYDLATLTSVYRVASFIVLGLLLMAGALAYQRLRPPPLPDLRNTTPAER